MRTRFSLSVENGQAEAGRDSRTCLARPNSKARTGTGGKSWSVDHEQDWQPYRSMPNLLCVMTILIFYLVLFSTMVAKLIL